MTLTELIKKSNNVFTFLPASEKSIQQAEKELNVTFSKEYTDYLAIYGAAVFDGHELTGLCDGKRLDVVDVTQKKRKRNNGTDNLYVLEETHIDGIIIWQASCGTVYATTGDTKPVKIANSLMEYLIK